MTTPSAKDSLREKFEAWQTCGHVHPFTCGGGGGPCSGVDLVFDAFAYNTLTIRCPNCGRVQNIGAMSPLGELLAGFTPRRPRLWDEVPPKAAEDAVPAKRGEVPDAR